MADLWRNNNDDRDRVRLASDIVRVIGEQVALKPKGREYTGLCPFHPDRNPSMNVVPGKQIFHCFVCGTGGDVFTFVQKFHKIEFREALEYLAERAGIELTPSRPAMAEGGSDNAVTTRQLREASALARDFFRSILRHPEHGKVARGIIERRAIDPDTAEQFELGASPDRWDGLVNVLTQRNLPLRAFVELGLVRARENASGHYDGFRNRLMFPIHDERGGVVAFGARKIKDEDEPKYLNSPDSRIFKKGTMLYGLPQARATIIKSRTALITEGYTDTIACHQGGFTNAVATLGTALTREHAAVLRRLCETVVLLFDGDDAGQRAADRAAEVFFSEELDVRVCSLGRFTDAKDPDELLKREEGAEVFRTALDQSTDVLEYRFARIRQRLVGKGLSALSRAIEEELARLVELGLGEVQPIRRQLIIKRLAGLAGVGEATVAASIPSGRGRRSLEVSRPGTPDSGSSGAFTLRLAEMSAREHLLGCALCDGALLEQVDAARRTWILGSGYRASELDRVALAAGRSAQHVGIADFAEVLAMLDSDPAAAEIAVALERAITRITDGDASRLLSHWTETWKRVEQERIFVPPEGVSAPKGSSPDWTAAISANRQAMLPSGIIRRVLPKGSG